MTTLIQSDLDDLRRETEAFGYETTMSDEITLALLDHIAQLTAERDEAIADNDDCHFEIAGKDTRIAELEAHASAQPNIEDAAKAAFLAHWPHYDWDSRPPEDSVFNKYKEIAQAVLATQPSAQFVAGMRKTLRKLSNEVLGCASAFEPELRRCLSHTNFNILVQRAEEARAILAEAALKGEGK